MENLEPLANEAKAAIAAALTPRSLQPDEVLFSEGDPAGTVFFVQAGELAVHRRSDEGQGSQDRLHGMPPYSIVSVLSSERVGSARSSGAEGRSTPSGADASHPASSEISPWSYSS